MTDIPLSTVFVPGRLGVRARLDGERLTMHLDPRPEVLHHGIVRASVLAFAIDAIAGIEVDDDPTQWAFTTDLSLRMRPTPDPGPITATNEVVRAGRRSITCAVELATAAGHLASGSIGFARVPLRDGDPPKPAFTKAMAPAIFDLLPHLSSPLREEAGVVSVDPGAGVVELAVTPQVTNPAGALQGAMVALAVEAAAEDLVAAVAGNDVVVTDLDIRFVAGARVGPVRSTARLLGPSPHDGVEVRLHDRSNGALTTIAYARAVPVGG